MKTTFRYFIFSVLLLLAAVPSFSQQENYNKQWVQGRFISFKTDFTLGGAVNDYWDTTNYDSNNFSHGHSNICDGSGNLLLATDASDIFDADHNIIDNGDTINTYLGYIEYHANAASQNSIILPLGDSIYYVFTGAFSDSAVYYSVYMGTLVVPGYDLVLYNVVDMKANSYQGKVVKKNRVAMDSVYTATHNMTAVRHANGHDWWLVRRGIDMDSDTTSYYVFQVQQDTVFGPYVQHFVHTPTGNSNFTAFGQASFSNDGRYYVNCHGGQDNYFELSDFDRCTGTFANHRRIIIPKAVVVPPGGGPSILDSIPSGICFSPNDSLIYIVTPYSVRQYELHNPDSATAWVAVGGMDTILTGFQFYVSIYAGHDDRLYIGNLSGGSTSMSVINSPNVKGMGANFCPKCLDFPVFAGIGNGNGGGVQQPPNMPNYTLGADPNCFTAILQQQESREAFTLYPNPADATLTIQSATGGSFQLVDMLGRVVLHITLSAAQPGKTISTAYLPAGIYTYRYTSGSTQATTGKLVIQH
jgi:hypothetical protein